MLLMFVRASFRDKLMQTSPLHFLPMVTWNWNECNILKYTFDDKFRLLCVYDGQYEKINFSFF